MFPSRPRAVARLLGKEPELKADFSRAQQALSKAKANKVARFLPNPEANWGPKPKHGRPLKPRPGAGGEAAEAAEPAAAGQAAAAEAEEQEVQPMEEGGQLPL